jgi:hypothetical protein
MLSCLEFPLRAAIALLMLSCGGSDITVSEKALCDGLLQPAEDTVDSPFDGDGDGFFDGANPDCAQVYSAPQLDCNDGDPTIHPGAAEVTCNGINEDCDEGSPDEEDADEDGVGSCADCADNDPLRWPGNEELTCTGVDEDCDEGTPDEEDLDMDGHSSCEDCVDTDSSVHPGGVELGCNGRDDDCDAATPDYADADLDGVSSCEDCDDNSSAVSPDQPETTCNGSDDDCNAETTDEPDGDGDGISACLDCNDSNGAVYPGATELSCNGVDDDCSSATPDVPGTEICGDGVDNDCDGYTDEDCTSDYTDAWQLDATIRYRCALGLVNVNFDEVYVFDSYPDITVTSATGSQPGTMIGSFTSSTTFEAENAILGSCDEIYTITGEFISTTEAEGELSLDFVGSCFDCTPQTYSFTATR